MAVQPDTAIKINTLLTMNRNILGEDVVSHIRGLVSSGSDSVSQLSQNLGNVEAFQNVCRQIYKATAPQKKKAVNLKLNTQVESGLDSREKEENEKKKSSLSYTAKRATGPTGPTAERKD